MGIDKTDGSYLSSICSINDHVKQKFDNEVITMAVKNVSLAERLLHAIGYELIAVAVFAPVMAWVFDKPIGSTGALALVLSFMAMVWNMAYNAMVDRVVASDRSKWGFLPRLMHGLGFEVGIVLLCLPVAAWMLQITFAQAFLVELGFFAFILPYTILYNWAFDKAKQRLARRQEVAA